MDRVGTYRHRVKLDGPTGIIPDGDGGFTNGFAPLDPPEADASIQAASTRDLERVTAGTVLATATHLIRMRFHPGVNVQTRITFKEHVFEVQSVQNVDQRDIALILICAEIVQAGVPSSTRPLTPPSSGTAPSSNWM